MHNGNLQVVVTDLGERQCRKDMTVKKGAEITHTTVPSM
jgi:hypothetical protein